MFKSFVLVSALALSLGLTGCYQQDSADMQQNQKQEMLTKAKVNSVGMPAITKFFEARMMKTILEMRDDPNLITYTYITDLNGNLHLRCNSIGYGLPYATQFTNPLKVTSEYGVNGNQHYADGVIAQSDPNGLYSPSSAEGTWVLCQNPKNKDDLKPVYLEDRVTVSPFPLQ